MDTLYIPVGKGEWSLKLAQIDKMTSIYKGAISSLVLDAELMATRLEAEPVSLEAPRSNNTEYMRIGAEQCSFGLQVDVSLHGVRQRREQEKPLVLRKSLST